MLECVSKTHDRFAPLGRTCYNAGMDEKEEQRLIAESERQMQRELREASPVDDVEQIREEHAKRVGQIKLKAYQERTGLPF